MNRWMKRTVTLLLSLVMTLALLPVSRVQAAAMRQGSRGTQVRYLQENLIGLGYLTGTADGSYGPKTVEAVQKFQAACGLAVDGSAGNATQTALRNAVIRLQAELKRAGYAPGSADGHFGSKTRRALKQYQADRGLKQTGVADGKTWVRINSESGGMRAGSAVRKGSSGTQVRYLQQALIGLGYLSGSADGKYGTKTAEAVRRYQSAYGLGADGSAGPHTMTSLKNSISALQSDLARKGWYSGTIDGVYGSGTRSAVKEYQRYVGVSATGVAGPRTMRKLYGYSLGGSDGTEEKTYKVWIDPLYQDGDNSRIWYDSEKKKYRTVHTSGCAGVAMAMALNALKNTDRYTGKSVMLWYVEHDYYYGQGTEHEGLLKYPRTLGLNTTYCGRASTLIEHLKKGRLALVLIRDITGEALFTYSGGGGHYVLVSGYRVKDGVDQVFVNNPLSYKSSRWFDLEDLMNNAIFRSDFDPIVVIYK